MKRVDLLYVKSEFTENGISLRTPDGKYGSSAAARDAGFQPGDRVTVVLASTLEELLNVAEPRRILEANRQLHKIKAKIYKAK